MKSITMERIVELLRDNTISDIDTYRSHLRGGEVGIEKITFKDGVVIELDGAADHCFIDCVILPNGEKFIPET